MNEHTISLKDVARKLNPISWDILHMLFDIENLNYTDIKKSLKVSQEKLAKEIARLEGALLIESKRDGVDERAKKFFITNNGKNILALEKLEE